MYTIVRKVDKIITQGAKELVTKGGNFDEVCMKTVHKAEHMYRGLDHAVLIGGFVSRYADALRKVA